MKYALAIILPGVICGSIYGIAVLWPAPTTPAPIAKAPVTEKPGRLVDGEMIASKPSGESPPKLEVIGSGSQYPIGVDERILVSFYLKNSGSEPVWVVRPLDGSEVGRSPKCVAKIRDEANQIVELTIMRECGNMNSLRETDFRLLQPGEVLKEPLHCWLSNWKPKPGIYSVTMTYDTTDPTLRAWAGRPATHVDPRCRELLALVPKVKVVSNIVKLQIVQ